VTSTEPPKDPSAQAALAAPYVQATATLSSNGRRGMVVPGAPTGFRLVLYRPPVSDRFEARADIGEPKSQKLKGQGRIEVRAREAQPIIEGVFGPLHRGRTAGRKLACGFQGLVYTASSSTQRATSPMRSATSPVTGSFSSR
jgi:hypothetical protein